MKTIKTFFKYLDQSGLFAGFVINRNPENSAPAAEKQAQEKNPSTPRKQKGQVPARKRKENRGWAGARNKSPALYPRNRGARNEHTNTRQDPKNRERTRHGPHGSMMYLGGFILRTSFSNSSSTARGEDQQSISRTPPRKTEQERKKERKEPSAARQRKGERFFLLWFCSSFPLSRILSVSTHCDLHARRPEIPKPCRELCLRLSSFCLFLCMAEWCVRRGARLVVARVGR